MDFGIDLYNIFAGFAESIYTDFFFWVLNTSISASFLVAAIIILRLLLKKAPKAIIVALWGLAAIRLICPFSLESTLSLIPSAETIPTEQFMYQEAMREDYELQIVTNPIYPQEIEYKMSGDVESNSWDSIYAYFGWLGGIGAMLIYSAASWIIIKRKVKISAPYKDNILLCDGIKTPFILGVFKPKIYLPSDISDKEKEYVIAHEKAHLRRRDHWWKPLGFLLLSFHWFNPLMWAAYILLCRDIEFACDEKVIKSLGEESKKPYSEALFNCSVPRKMIAACPVAFGEVGVKSRIKSVLNYKKPAFWIILVAIIACTAVAIGFMTNPVDKEKNAADNITVLNSGSELGGLSVEITDSDFSDFAPYIEIEWKNGSEKDLLFGEEHHFYRKANGEWQDCNESGSSIFHSIGYMLGSGKTFPKRYGIMHLDMSEAGRYRFVSHCSEQGSNADADYEVWIEFEVKEGTEFPNIHQFSVTDYVYDNGSFSWIGPEVEYIEPYRLYGGMNLQKYSGFEWSNIGHMEEITLVKDNFDDRLRNSQIWYDGLSIDVLKKENKRAWQLHASDSGYDPLYMLLEQKNGEFYLCYGYYNAEGMVDPNSDSSFIRWIYRLEQTEPTFLNGENVKHLPYGYNLAYARYTDDSRIISNSLNLEKMALSSIQHLPIYKIESAEELEDFKNKFSDIFDFSKSGNGQSSFDRAVKYHKFDISTLFVIYVTAPSLSYEFGVDSVYNVNGEFIAHISRTAPETGDTAMMGQFITLSVNKSDIAGCTSFDADLNNRFSDHMRLSIAIKAAIRNHNKDSFAGGEYQSEAFTILKSESYPVHESAKETEKARLKLYMLTRYETYGVKNGSLELFGSNSSPAILTLIENADGTYSPLEYYVLKKGDTSDDAKLLEELCNAYEDGDRLGEECLAEAQAYFGISGEDMSENPPEMQTELNTEAYIFYDSVDMISPSLVLNTDEKTATFCYSGFSSYIGYCTYEITDNRLILTSNDDFRRTYVFEVRENCMVFVAEESTKIPEYNYGEDIGKACPVPDGAIFEKVPNQG